MSGIDSIVKLNLIVVGSEASFQLLGANLVADLDGASYQWVDCDADTLITGETSQVFSPTSSGNYSLIVSMAGCVDTTACMSFTKVFAPNRMISFQRWTGSETAPTVMNYTDPYTADLFPIDSTGVGQITAAAFDPTTGLLYGSHGGGGCCPVSGYAGCVLVGDTTTGAISVVACDTIYGGNDNMAGIGFDSKGNMWGILLASNTAPANDTMYLVSVDKVTGEITLRADLAYWTGNGGNGMAFGPDDVLYYSNGDVGFGYIDTLIGDYTSIGLSTTGFPPGNWNKITDMTYDFLDDLMYVAVSDADNTGPAESALGIINLTTGVVSFVDTFPNFVNSIAVVPTVFSETTVEACDSYDWNGMTLTASGVYTDTSVTVVYGIDSLAVLNLTISTIDPSVTIMGDTVTANQAGATYQWLDCDAGNAPLPGATGQTLIPVATGNYAVMITNGSCVDTSACNTITGRIAAHPLKAFNIYPNPAGGELFLDIPTTAQTPEITIYNSVGMVIAKPGKEAVNENRVSLKTLSAGIYLIELRDGNQKISRRFVKK